jgi:phenylalanine-4-hydroxylase
VDRVLQTLPENLKAYTAVQDYARYTPRDQAAWRYIMRQSRRFFQDNAHHIYMDGLAKTGIAIDEIPRIQVMHEKLSEFGWGAICVTGFIPPAAFLEFQARSLLPIAADMRTLEHIAYTPAPDIVHEAAGHAPIIADKQYADYLTKYARLARKAIYSDQDVRLYEAVRMLSDMKENPDASPDAIQDAEGKLNDATSAFTFVSESAQITRMYWWTAEYGLVRDGKDLKIYGAGLLSSIGESQNCLSAGVKKLPMSLACVNTPFNITEPQPQLFVADSFGQLVAILDEMEATMAFRRGGKESVEKALKAKAVTTTILDSGIGISGVVTEFLIDSKGDVSFMKWSGPVQLSEEDHQLPGQGRERHPEGFSTPIGEWREAPGQDLSNLTDEQLKRLGIAQGQPGMICFASGFEVAGTVVSFVRGRTGKLIAITWSGCTVRKDGETFYRPEWGLFDMAVGAKIPSVHGGPADFANFGQYNFGNVSSQPGRLSPYTAEEKMLFQLYQELRDLRKNPPPTKVCEEILALAAKRVMANFRTEWLVALEVLELYAQLLGRTPEADPTARELRTTVLNPDRFDPETRQLIDNGLSLLAVKD